MFTDPTRIICNLRFVIVFNSFLILHKQVKIGSQHNDKSYIDGQKGYT